MPYSDAASMRTVTRSTMTLRLGLLAGLAVIVVLAAVLVAGSGGASSHKSASPAATESALKGIPQSGIALGSPKAPVTMVEFADLQCPFCAEYSNQALPTVVDKYVRTGRVKYELRVVGILGDQSVKAAGAAAAATKENKLYQFTDLFYRLFLYTQGLQ